MRVLFKVLLNSIPLIAVASTINLQGAATRLVWPTPNTAFREGLGMEHYLQPTQSGDPQSGGFGCVRNKGTRFHEGVDLKALRHDSKGEASDPIYAAMDGKVAYVNRVPGKSSYGRYIVLMHDGQKPAFYSLYAHLRLIEPHLETGFVVKAGDTLGIMGRSATYTIPKERAHLHFEIGLQLSEAFQEWYDLKKFESPNEHGDLNGMNLIGFDPLAFFSVFREKDSADFDDYLGNLAVAFTLRINTRKTPNFIRRYPSLQKGEISDRTLVGWDVDFTGFGLPVGWKPLSNDGLLEPWKENRVILLDSKPGNGIRFSCRNTISADGSMGSHLSQVLELLFKFQPR